MPRWQAGHGDASSRCFVTSRFNGCNDRIPPGTKASRLLLTQKIGNFLYRKVIHCYLFCAPPATANTGKPSPSTLFIISKTGTVSSRLGGFSLIT
ncbi:MAG: hypothetical protein V4679_23745, partial [Pseudomonadota bacterium]